MQNLALWPSNHTLKCLNAQFQKSPYTKQRRRIKSCHSLDSRRSKNAMPVEFAMDEHISVEFCIETQSSIFSIYFCLYTISSDVTHCQSKTRDSNVPKCIHESFHSNRLGAFERKFPQHAFVNFSHKCSLFLSIIAATCEYSLSLVRSSHTHTIHTPIWKKPRCLYDSLHIANTFMVKQLFFVCSRERMKTGQLHRIA